MDEYDFWHVRLLAKIGLAVDKGNLTYGFTLTTPGLGLFGSGKVLTSETYSGLDLDDDGTTDPAYLSSNYQESLPATWKSPLSIAGGLSFDGWSDEIPLDRGVVRRRQGGPGHESRILLLPVQPRRGDNLQPDLRGQEPGQLRPRRSNIPSIRSLLFTAPSVPTIRPSPRTMPTICRSPTGTCGTFPAAPPSPS